MSLTIKKKHIPALGEPPTHPPFGILPNDPEGEQMLIEEGGFIKWVDGPKVYLHQIYVKKEYREKGVGKKLMQRLKDIAAGRPMYLYSTADKTNPFYHFLKSEGWKQETYELWTYE